MKNNEILLISTDFGAFHGRVGELCDRVSGARCLNTRPGVSSVMLDAHIIVREDGDPARWCLGGQIQNTMICTFCHKV